MSYTGYCKKCHRVFSELSPEGECFECSTGDRPEEAEVGAKHFRESMHNIAQGLAHKTDILTKEAKARMLEGAKDKGS